MCQVCAWVLGLSLAQESMDFRTREKTKGAKKTGINLEGGEVWKIKGESM